MKVLSMIQPWAILLALRELNYEARSWSTRYRGPLAIHASQKTDKHACREQPIRSILDKHGYTEKSLPNGVILATCRLVNCYQVIDTTETSAILHGGRIITGKDYMLSGFAVGDYAWEVVDMHLLSHYIPAKGKLGLWEFPLDP